ncbi:hypothetical protein D3C83_117220 [compost metagenome]
MRTSYVRDFVAGRLLGAYEALATRGANAGTGEEVDGLAALADRLGKVDWQGRVQDFLGSPELWLGVVAAALLLAAAMWVRRYRDETS